MAYVRTWERLPLWAALTLGDERHEIVQLLLRKLRVAGHHRLVPTCHEGLGLHDRRADEDRERLLRPLRIRDEACLRQCGPRRALGPSGLERMAAATGIRGEYLLPRSRIAGCESCACREGDRGQPHDENESSHASE